MGNSQSTVPTMNQSTLIHHLHQYSIALLEYYNKSKRAQRIIIWLIIIVAIQRMNRHNLIGFNIYAILQLLSLPPRHIFEVIFNIRDDEQNLMKLSLREQLCHDLLRYTFLYLPIEKQRKLSIAFAALGNKLHPVPIDRVYLHETNNPYSKDVYIDWYNGANNITQNTKVILFSHGGM